MLRKHRAISTFLIVGISLFFSIASAYANYKNLVEADFLTPAVKFEAEDIDDLLVDKQTNWDFMPSEFLVIESLEIDLPGLFIMSSFQMGFIAPPFSVLRC